MDNELRIEAVFTEVAKDEHFIGISLNKCSQIVQIEVIQFLRQKLLIQQDEKIYFRSNKELLFIVYYLKPTFIVYTV